MAHTKRPLGQASLIQKDDVPRYTICIDLEWSIAPPQPAPQGAGGLGGTVEPRFIGVLPMEHPRQEIEDYFRCEISYWHARTSPIPHGAAMTKRPQGIGVWKRHGG